MYNFCPHNFETIKVVGLKKCSDISGEAEEGVARLKKKRRLFLKLSEGILA